MKYQSNQWHSTKLILPTLRNLMSLNFFFIHIYSWKGWWSHNCFSVYKTMTSHKVFVNPKNLTHKCFNRALFPKRNISSKDFGTHLTFVDCNVALLQSLARWLLLPNCFVADVSNLEVLKVILTVSFLRACWKLKERQDERLAKTA